MDVMIVDDNAKMRQLVRQILSHRFEHVIECGSGEECLRVFREHPVEWVLMDVQMAGMSGIDATRELTREYPDARVVIVTRYDDDELRKTALEAGAKGFVTKTNLTSLSASIDSMN